MTTITPHAQIIELAVADFENTIAREAVSSLPVTIGAESMVAEWKRWALRIVSHFDLTDAGESALLDRLAEIIGTHQALMQLRGIV